MCYWVPHCGEEKNKEIMAEIFLNLKNIIKICLINSKHTQKKKFLHDT